MAPRLWDAYATLELTSRDACRMTCVGQNKDGQDCTTFIDNIPYITIRRIISKIEFCPPDENRWPKTLIKLANLSLCSSCQIVRLADIDELLELWRKRIMKAVHRYEKRMAQVEAEKRLRKTEEENEELKRKLERLESRGICKLHIEVQTLQSQLAAERSEHIAAARLAVSEQKMIREEAALFKSQLSMSNNRVVELCQELDESGASNEILASEIKGLKREKVLKESSHKELTLELVNIKAENTFLANKAVGLEDTLERERTASSALILRLKSRLEATIISRVKLRKTIKSLAYAKRDLEASTATREKNTAAVIAVLTRRVEYVKSHPFSMFLVSLMVSVKGWEGIVAERLRWLSSWVPYLF
ncbi:hypothetical protein DL98DRAFT_590599 [Cadophora sp. DSE1049]|nr:hypothetical protein DL98DRAFT_590599 [Cadophora sp. DSE1049]